MYVLGQIYSVSIYKRGRFHGVKYVKLLRNGHIYNVCNGRLDLEKRIELRNHKYFDKIIIMNDIKNATLVSLTLFFLQKMNKIYKHMAAYNSILMISHVSLHASVSSFYKWLCGALDCFVIFDSVKHTYSRHLQGHMGECFRHIQCIWCVLNHGIFLNNQY